MPIFSKIAHFSLHTATIILRFALIFGLEPLEKTRRTAFFATRCQHFGLYLPKRALLNYDNVPRMPVSRYHPRRVQDMSPSFYDKRSFDLMYFRKSDTTILELTFVKKRAKSNYCLENYDCYALYCRFMTNA